MLGAPSGALLGMKADQSDSESRISRLILPLNSGPVDSGVDVELFGVQLGRRLKIRTAARTGIKLLLKEREKCIKKIGCFVIGGGEIRFFLPSGYSVLPLHFAFKTIEFLSSYL